MTPGYVCVCVACWWTGTGEACILPLMPNVTGPSVQIGLLPGYVCTPEHGRWEPSSMLIMPVWQTFINQTAALYYSHSMGRTYICTFSLPPPSTPNASKYCWAGLVDSQSPHPHNTLSPVHDSLLAQPAAPNNMRQVGAAQCTHTQLCAATLRHNLQNSLLSPAPLVTTTHKEITASTRSSHHHGGTS